MAWAVLGTARGLRGKAGFPVGLNPLWGQAELAIKTVGMRAGWQQIRKGWLGGEGGPFR